MGGFFDVPAADPLKAYNHSGSPSGGGAGLWEWLKPKPKPAPPAPAPELVLPPLVHELAKTPAGKKATGQDQGPSALEQLLGMANRQSGTSGVTKAQGELQATLNQLNAKFDQRERALNAQYSNLDSPTAQETRRWKLQSADLLAEKTAALGSVKVAFDTGRHNNAMTESKARVQSSKDAAAMSDLYSAAAAGAAADASASAGLSDGGLVGGDGIDVSGTLREEQANQAALSKATGDNTADELRALGAGLEEQRVAQSGAVARASAWAQAQARQDWEDKVSARQQHDQDTLYSALAALDNARVSTLSDYGMKKADLTFQGAQADQAFRRGLITSALADPLKAAGAQQASKLGLGAGGAGSFLATLRGTGVDQKIAQDTQRPTQVLSQVQNSEGMLVDSTVFSSDYLAQTAKGLLAGVKTKNPAEAQLLYTQAINQLSKDNPPLYDAMVKAGYGPNLFALSGQKWTG